jgi:GNAT superfamily N-acetyltransferase
MHWRTTDDVAEFLASAGEWLRRRPEEHTLALTVAETVRQAGPTAYGGGPALFGWCGQDGTVEGAFVHTPPHPPVLTPVPAPAAAALAETLADQGRTVGGVTADDATADAFASAWCARSGEERRLRFRQRLYRLGELTPPDPLPAGRDRPATGADRDLLVRWFDEFAVDAGEPRRDAGPLIDRRLTYGGLTLWELDGVPVSMAGHTPTVAGMSRIGPVYTPHRQRRRGYGAAVTAAATRRALGGGALHVVLFTDLANPTSNAIYQRLGYRPIEDSVVVEFGDP